MTQNLFMLLLSLNVLLFSVSLFLKTNQNTFLESTTPFECGFNPTHLMRMAFSLRFFFLTILFLIFDIEITILFPLSLSATEMPWNTFFMCHLFMWAILLFSTLLEWTQGALSWLWFCI